MQINTKKLQLLLSKSLKGASLNKLIPITSFVGIEYYPSTDKMMLLLKTTDGTNYLNLFEVAEDSVNDNYFYAVVEVEQLCKLVSKITTDTVELSLDKERSTLHIHGNGDYDISLQYDENGNNIEFPNPVKYLALKNLGNLSSSMVQDSLNYCKSSLAQTLEEPVYTNYYVGKEIVTTDISKICKLNRFVFEEPKLISSAIMELLGVIEEPTINVETDESNKYIVFETPNVMITGSLIDGIENYQIVAIDGLLQQEYKNSCKVNKDALFNALDRVSLFIDKYDNDGVKLVFKENELLVQNLKTTGVESIKLKEQHGGEFTCIAPNGSLMELLKSVSEEFIEIQYGEDNAIKLIHGDVVQVLALLEE